MSNPSPATIAKAYRVAAQLGINYSPEQGATEKLDEFQRLMHTRRPMSAEAKAHISAALRGKHHAGHPMSSAAKARISAGLKLYYANHPDAGSRISARLRGNHYHKGKHGANQYTRGR